MPITSGSRLGPYEIVSLLGAGGMGEVYRARDSKLNREVALKVLPEAVAGDPDRLVRFRREAQVLASLNHPNIAQIYGFEDDEAGRGSQSGGAIHALVMELVDGPTLSDRIAQSPVPLVDALPIAKQIADALEAAHEQGIIHRDLKPANIKVRPDGTVKVLDFGLAKLAQDGSGLQGPGSANRALSLSPTLTSPALMTGVGVILGTAAYMAPEQAKGRAVDRRADIWAFGVVLFEMLTGTRAFEGEDVTDVIVAVMSRELDWAALPAATPRAVRDLLKRCLDRDVTMRLRDIGEARIAIQRAITHPDDDHAAAAVTERASPRFRRLAVLGWAVAGGVLLGSAAIAEWVRSRPAPDAPSYRATILPPDKNPWAAVTPATRFAVSPDGRRLAFLANGADGVNRIWVRSLDSLEAQPLSGSDNVVLLFWSYDSRRIAFAAGGKLRVMSASGGPAVTIADIGANNGGTWNQDDVILFTPDAAGGIARVNASGGAVVPVTHPDKTDNEGGHWQAFFLPDGRHFLFHQISSQGHPNGAVYVAAIDGRDKPKLLIDWGSNAQYASGRVLFTRDATLMAQPFDVDRLELRGEAVPIAEQVAVGGSTGRSAAVSVARDGALVYQNGGASNTDSQLTWYDRSGKEISQVAVQGDLADVQLSPDNSRIALSITDPATRTRDIWLVDVKRGFRSRFTFEPADEIMPLWSRDGSQVFFTARAGGMNTIDQKPVSGLGDATILFSSHELPVATSLSADGATLLLTQDVFGLVNGSDIYQLPLAGARTPVALVKTRFNESAGTYSPDGRWVAYQSNESGRNEVYVAPASGTAKWQVSQGGGQLPRWRGDGRELFYVSVGGERKLMAAEVSGSATGFEVGVVRTLFTPRVRFSSPRYFYDVTADGRFVFITGEESSALRPLTLVLNWAAGLKR
jgi:serine/threonine protein kinase/Tol biopolymer transport system component